MSSEQVAPAAPPPKATPKSFLLSAPPLAVPCIFRLVFYPLLTTKCRVFNIK